MNGNSPNIPHTTPKLIKIKTNKMHSLKHTKDKSRYKPNKTNIKKESCHCQLSLNSPKLSTLFIPSQPSSLFQPYPLSTKNNSNSSPIIIIKITHIQSCLLTVSRAHSISQRALQIRNLLKRLIKLFNFHKFLSSKFFISKIIIPFNQKISFIPFEAISIRRNLTGLLIVIVPKLKYWT